MTCDWVAREDGDGLGYDALSFEVSGGVPHTELKTTALAPEAPFYMSSAELDFARGHAETYRLCRVARVDDGLQFLVLRGGIAADVEMTPVTYRVREPRRCKRAAREQL
jgi:Domain of unknown function (DUF3883)